MSFEDVLDSEPIICPNPECKSDNVSKSEDILGVEYSYELVTQEDGTKEWEQTDSNHYGDCTVTYTCNVCNRTWT